MAADYAYIDAVKLGLNAANARNPRLQKSAIAEFGQMLSREVTAGDWAIDGDEALNSKGQNVEQYLDHLISTRPHWEIPATVIDAADDTWTSGDLTKQGKRWKQLRAFLGNDETTNAAIAAEAALYGAKPGSTVKGVKPGEVVDDGDTSAAAALFKNPWSPKYKGSPQQADAEKDRIIKRTGSKGAAATAAKAGFSVMGVPLR